MAEISNQAAAEIMNISSYLRALANGNGPNVGGVPNNLARVATSLEGIEKQLKRIADAKVQE